MEMLNEILREARWLIWDAERRGGTPCNAMSPDAPLDAYCLARNLRTSPSHHGWYNEVQNHPGIWSARAINMFDDWVYANSELVRQYVFSISRRLVNEVMADNC